MASQVEQETKQFDVEQTLKYQQLNYAYQSLLKMGLIQYDRRAMSGLQWDPITKTVRLPSIKSVSGNYAGQNAIVGSCRDIAPKVAALFQGYHRAKMVSVWGCADKATGEYHYITVANFESLGWMIADAGYQQPVPELIPVGGLEAYEIKSDFYAGKLREGQLYGNKVVTYGAYMPAPDEIVFEILSGEEQVKKFLFKPLDEALDKAIIKGFLGVTCGVKSSSVHRGIFKLEKYDPIPVFTEIYQHLKNGGGITIEYTD